MKPIAPTDPRIQAMAARCASKKFGLSCAALMAETGMGRSLCQGILRQCRLQGLLVLYKVPDGDFCWMSPADHQEGLNSAANAWLMRRRRAGSNLYKRRRECGLINSDNTIADPPEWPIRRSYIKAGEVPPPETVAANSVFSWRPAA